MKRLFWEHQIPRSSCRKIIIFGVSLSCDNSIIEQDAESISSYRAVLLTMDEVMSNI